MNSKRPKTSASPENKNWFQDDGWDSDSHSASRTRLPSAGPSPARNRNVSMEVNKVFNAENRLMLETRASTRKSLLEHFTDMKEEEVRREWRLYGISHGYF